MDYAQVNAHSAFLLKWPKHCRDTNWRTCETIRSCGICFHTILLLSTESSTALSCTLVIPSGHKMLCPCGTPTIRQSSFCLKHHGEGDLPAPFSCCFQAWTKHILASLLLFPVKSKANTWKNEILSLLY